MTKKATKKRRAKKKQAKVRRNKQARLGERGLPVWPADKPIPKFKSYEEEVTWWHSHDHEPGPEKEWQELVYEPRATRQPREHVYRVRFNDEEMAILQTLAKRRGVS